MSTDRGTSTDRWTLTLAALRGEPWPALPAMPGRVHVAADDAGPDRAEVLASDASDSECALLLGLSRQRVHQLRAALARNTEGST